MQHGRLTTPVLCLPQQASTPPSLLDGSIFNTANGFRERSQGLNIVAPLINEQMNLPPTVGAITNGNSASNSTSLVLTPNQQRFYPFILHRSLFLSLIRINVITAVTGTFALALFNSLPNSPYPDAKIVEGLSISSSTTGIRNISFSTVLVPKGLLFLALWTDIAPTVRANAVASIPAVLGYNTSFGANGQYTALSLSATYTAGVPFTTPPSGMAGVANSASPMILLN